MERVQIQSNRENLEQAFEIAERLGVTRLLDAEGGCPGWQCRDVPASLALPFLTAFLLPSCQTWTCPLRMRNP